MLCYRDMTFCDATERCGNLACHRRWTPEEQAKARTWWSGDDPPVAFADLSGRECFQPLPTHEGEA